MQLALVGSMAQDDPEGWELYQQCVAYTDNDPDVFILSNVNNVGSVSTPPRPAPPPASRSWVP